MHISGHLQRAWPRLQCAGVGVCTLYAHCIVGAAHMRIFRLQCDFG